ncbi:MAG: DUF4417 domain-containing protein [Actinobacteria bacterium]|nr:DUF4417 domain-containing protein [Actinomycetota bacterium]
MTTNQIIASETVLVPVTKLKGYEKNPRKGNVKAIAESLQVNKQYRPIVVQKSSNKILAGNHTWQAAKSLGWTEIAVVFVDVDDEAAKRIVLADNKTNDLADYDNAVLAELLRDLGGVSGTGYSDADMEAILNATAADAEQTQWASNTAGEEALAQNDPLISVSQGLGVATSDEDEIQFGDEDEEDIEDSPDDLSGVYTLKDEMEFQGATYWQIPLLRSDMLIEELPQPLHTWAGSATRDMDWDGYWLYNWGIDSTSGMKDLSKIVLSFYCYDEYFESWFDDTVKHMSKVLHAKIKYAITPNYSQDDIPRAVSLYQLFRSRWVGRYLQEIGVRVMPDLECIADDEYIKVFCRSLPKDIPWASLQVQNLVSTMDSGNKETPERRALWVETMRKIITAVGVKNLLAYAPPKRFEETKGWFSDITNVYCIETRLHYLSQKVRSNAKDSGRL